MMAIYNLLWNQSSASSKVHGTHYSTADRLAACTFAANQQACVHTHKEMHNHSSNTQFSNVPYSNIPQEKS